jgi:hypothetical protein
MLLGSWLRDTEKIQRLVNAQKGRPYSKGFCTIVPVKMYMQVLRGPKSLFAIGLRANEGSVGLGEVAASMGVKMGFA